MRPTDAKMAVIGITGGIGAGKSTVLNVLSALPGVRVEEADRVGHLVMEPGTEGFRKIRAHFGTQVLERDGRIDRRTLAEIVFSDRQELAWLNSVIHPAVKEWFRREIRLERERGRLRLFIIEAALLIEDHYEELCEEFWYIYTEPEIRRARLKESRGYSDEKIDAIFRKQCTDAEFRTHCAQVIDNNSTKEAVYERVDILLGKLGIHTTHQESGTFR